MVKNALIDLKKAATGFRLRMMHRSSRVKKIKDFEITSQSEDLLKSESAKDVQDKIGSNENYLYAAEDIKVSASHIEIDEHIYVLSYIAATRRTEKPLPKNECILSLAFTSIALFVLIIYIFIGKLKFGLAAVIYLSLALLAFMAVYLICKQMKARYTLEFRNFNGELIDTINRSTRGAIAELEEAVKQAIKLSHRHINADS